MQLAELVQEIPDRAVPLAGGGGVRTSFQFEPFHDSAKVRSLGDAGVPLLPTAMQLDALVHAMPSRLAPEFLSFGVGTIVHLLPFQTSASGDGTRFPVEVKIRDWPTAIQSVLLTHEMAFSWAPPPRCCGEGMATILHAWPFHDSASVK